MTVDRSGGRKGIYDCRGAGVRGLDNSREEETTGAKGGELDRSREEGAG